ncbi:RDD family protein [Streptomyces sp. ISL-94]|uniref:RDD family protein n=1 Tax=Streptomyces sp. ISL-94 TaxID=2819190 RepID=UPI001BEA0773|nr:RDD family protein [Streptomyces sp. ISL-94]MBT2481043.1 RDD family protein [Streptomyces sp. ISL-94]
MSFGDPNNPYSQQPPQGRPGYPQQAPQGVPPQYGHPQQTPPPYGAYPPPGMPGMPGMGPAPLAHWGLRAGALLLDGLIVAGPMYALGFIDLANSDHPEEPGVLGVIGMLYAFAMGLFQIYLQGKTGQTTGKKVVGISVRRESDGSTLGFGMALVRWLAHFLDSIACYLGWLWPLWDEKKQTFADKVCGTVVITVDKG